jgi:hypothetical protein
VKKAKKGRKCIFFAKNEKKVRQGIVDSKNSRIFASQKKNGKSYTASSW